MSGHDSEPSQGQYWTISYPIREGEVCLPRHTRGPGKGRRNGYGGKGEPPFPSWMTMVGEHFGESHSVPLHWRHMGTLQMAYNGLYLPAHLYVVDRFFGEPRASEEMTDPRWFKYDDVPYDELWPGDYTFLPEVFAGYRVQGRLAIGKTAHGELFLDGKPDIQFLK